MLQNTNTKVVTYFYKTGQDKDKNFLYTFEAREPDKRALIIREGKYKDECEDLAAQVKAHPEYYGF